MMDRPLQDRMNEISKGALSATDSAFLCQVLLDEKRYLARSKAFLTAERVADEAVLAAAERIILDDKEEREWQLRAFSVLNHHPRKASLQASRRCLFQREKPLLIRAALLTAANIGGKEAAKLCADFLASPFCGYLKDDFIGSCLHLFLKEEDNAICFRSLIGEDPELSDYVERLLAKTDENDVLTVYPYPDYLWRSAEVRDVKAEEWKDILFFPRKKKKKRITEAEVRS